MLSLCTSKSQNGLYSNPNFTCSNNGSAVTFGSMFGSLSLLFCVTDAHKQAPSTSWTCGSDLGTLVNSLEIIFGSCDFLPLQPTTYQRLSQCEFHVASMSLSRALTVTGKQSVNPDAWPGGIWLVWVQPVGWWWRCVFRMICASVSRRTNPDLRAAVPPLLKKKHNPFLQLLGATSND